jgi:hypothetical protein
MLKSSVVDDKRRVPRSARRERKNQLKYRHDHLVKVPSPRIYVAVDHPNDNEANRNDNRAALVCKLSERKKKSAGQIGAKLGISRIAW